MHDERQHEDDAGLGAAPQGTSDEGRPDVGGDPDADDTQGGGEHHPSGGGGSDDDPLAKGQLSDPDAEEADPESGAAADQPERPDAGHA
ncbi:MAG: hypothetical protein M3131_10595 [Actinomycetota bacterium]|nr:hypothetical protein [Actinomycetota bacterium]